VRILVVTTKSPYPLFEGRALRSYNLIKQAAKRHEIHLASFIQTPEEVAGIEHMKSICSVVRSHRLYFDNPRMDGLRDALRELPRAAPLPVVKYDTAAMRQTLRELLATHRYDLVHVDMLHLSEYLDLFEGLPTVLMGHNVESMILERRAANESRWLARTYLRYQHRKLVRYETRACQRATKVVAVSRADADVLAAWTGRDDIAVVPNGVDTSFFDVPAVPFKPGSMVYVGGFTWFPNEDAIQYFARDVLPLIAKEVPEANLTVVGKNPDNAAVRALSENPRIKLTGMVDDIRPLVAESAVYIVTLRIGGGTRLKILDALSMSKAIVSTSIGCEGLEVTDGQDITVADDPQSLANAVVRLLRDPDEARRLGRAGRALVEQRYEWNVLGEGLDSVYLDAQSAAASGQARVTLAT
jgi:polysaccharide biosynthesis protein PslH